MTTQLKVDIMRMLVFLPAANIIQRNFQTVILEDTTEDLFPDRPSSLPDDYTPTERTRERIEQILKEEKARLSRTWQHYENLRKSDPAKYWLPKTQVQMHRDAIYLGKNFELAREAFNEGGAND